MVQALDYLLVLCWRPAVKSRVEGRVFCTDISSQLDFAFSALITLTLTLFVGILLTCETLFEGSLLTWYPAGVVHTTCMRKGQSPKQGGGQKTSDRWDCL